MNDQRDPGSRLKTPVTVTAVGRADPPGIVQESEQKG
jgi:hypothetical protein